jgi:hypothetical protein
MFYDGIGIAWTFVRRFFGGEIPTTYGGADDQVNTF